ncbi:group II intron reverse transcriptase/maturase [Serratia entomophila]|uniref:group II intron reverse transcriptase/maturase n=1 Tax=Serratia entomophila TaxID=42906 RepID=UPI001F4BF2C0|nr:group II intron reverse transcriptase/maturase [Serratia entomophila]ULG11560.1 group II intron reverse transcriptase/maturase [Serratia entomophila]CAI1978613.1 Group II intron-encoded protein ltrA [Serratia entomophila]CAI1986548.1 Group II intron-encoded protein ltrA [Serratia entomophila]
MVVSGVTNGSALSDILHNWHSINWRRVVKNVRRMQMRIAKATQASDWRRVKSLQRSLTRSFSARAMAVRRVTENQGKRTSGVDHVLWDTHESRFRAIGQLNIRGYKSKPLRRIYIPKSNGKKRPLGIPTMKDRAMQALYHMALDPVAESTSDANSYGFRLNRSTADAEEQIFICLAPKRSAKWVLEADIAGCFDNISHDWLFQNIPVDKRALNTWLKAGTVFNGEFQETTAGTPQGGIISPTLANMALNGLEFELRGYLKKTLGARNTILQKINVVRYADDFIITGKTSEILNSVVRPWIERFLRERGLTLSEEKTRITHIDDGFDFLGWNFRKYAGKLLVKPSADNMKRFYQKIRETVKNNMATEQTSLIHALNSKLRGWGKYHQHVVSKAIFYRMEHQIFQLLWRWARRRHPNKAVTWVKRRYFHVVGNRSWVFAAKVKREKGIYLHLLHRMSEAPIKRHIKTKADYHPYSSTWELYGENLRQKRMLNDMGHRREWTRLYYSQQGRCAMCCEVLTKETGWHDHHIVYRQHGGSDALANRVLLHPVCHQKLHSNGLTVVKPAYLNRF